jgi:hypothetical protein
VKQRKELERMDEAGVIDLEGVGVGVRSTMMGFSRVPGVVLLPRLSGMLLEVGLFVIPSDLLTLPVRNFSLFLICFSHFPIKPRSKT